MYLTIFTLDSNRAPIIFVYAVAVNHTVVHVFFKVFLSFYRSCTWIPVRAAKEAKHKQI